MGNAEKDHREKLEKLYVRYSEMYNESADRNGVAAAIDSLNNLRDDFKKQFNEAVNRTEKQLNDLEKFFISPKIGGIDLRPPNKKDHKQYQTLHRFWHNAMMGIDYVQYHEDHFKPKSYDLDEIHIREIDSFLKKVRSLAHVSLNEIVLGNLISYLQQNNYPAKLSGGNPVQVGRPEDFPSKKTHEWYRELRELVTYQHKNGKPHKTNIKKEIIKRHSKLREDNAKPSMDTINDHFRKLGLTES